jgi:hypothetical protein
MGETGGGGVSRDKAVHIVFREPRSSRVAKWLKIKSVSLSKLLRIGPLNNGKLKAGASFRADDNC